MPLVRISDDERRRRGDRLSTDPAVDRLYALLKVEAERRGGRTLEIWKLHMGKLWDRPYVMSGAAVAEKLRLPLSVVSAAIKDVRAAVRDEWMASPEYKQSGFDRR